MRTTCECKGCEDRYVGCHSECEKYKAFVEKNNEERNKIKAMKIKSAEYHLHKNNQVIKALRKKR